MLLFPMPRSAARSAPASLLQALHASHATSLCNLAHAAYICGAEFTLADVAIAAYLAWLPYFVKCDPEWVLEKRYPVLAEYTARVMARPAVGSNVPLEWIKDSAAWLL